MASEDIMNQVKLFNKNYIIYPVSQSESGDYDQNTSTILFITSSFFCAECTKLNFFWVPFYLHKFEKR